MKFKNKDLEEFIAEIPIPNEILTKKEPVSDSEFVANLAAYVAEKVDINYFLVKYELEQHYVTKIYGNNNFRSRT